MASAAPPGEDPVKILLPFLQRADELQKIEPLVSYYCRLYAMERGLRFPSKERTRQVNELLQSIMGQLEKDKKTLKLSPDDGLYVEGFAQRVFAKADKQDRAGRADIGTAKTFYAAAIFLEVLQQFGDLSPELEQKQKYAVWKAGDVRKALKEGRKPTPGPPGGDPNDLPGQAPGAVTTGTLSYPSAASQSATGPAAPSLSAAFYPMPQAPSLLSSGQPSQGQSFFGQSSFGHASVGPSSTTQTLQADLDTLGFPSAPSMPPGPAPTTSSTFPTAQSGHSFSSAGMQPPPPSAFNTTHSSLGPSQRPVGGGGLGPPNLGGFAPSLLSGLQIARPVMGPSLSGSIQPPFGTHTPLSGIPNGYPSPAQSSSFTSMSGSAPAGHSVASRQAPYGGLGMPPAPPAPSTAFSQLQPLPGTTGAAGAAATGGLQEQTATPHSMYGSMFGGTASSSAAPAPSMPSSAFPAASAPPAPTSDNSTLYPAPNSASAPHPSQYPRFGQPAAQPTAPSQPAPAPAAPAPSHNLPASFTPVAASSLQSGQPSSGYSPPLRSDHPTVLPSLTSSGYSPPPGKVAEAHKAARFAVSALAFDDVPTAIDFLQKSLDLLQNPLSRS